MGDLSIHPLPILDKISGGRSPIMKTVLETLNPLNESNFPTTEISFNIPDLNLKVSESSSPKILDFSIQNLENCTNTSNVLEQQKPLVSLHQDQIPKVSLPLSNACTTGLGLPVKYHPYQNLPNLRVMTGHSPGRRVLTAKKVKGLQPINEHTEKLKARSPIHDNAYIQLWNGIAANDICSDLTDTSGYVQMNSPYLRSSGIVSPILQPENQYCFFCGKHFSKKQFLLNHLDLLHRKDMKNNSKHEEFTGHPCPVCSTQFVESRILSVHLIDHHQKQLFHILEKNGHIAMSADVATCLVCQKSISRELNWEEFLTSHIIQCHKEMYYSFIFDLFPPVLSTSNRFEVPSQSKSPNIFNFQPSVIPCDKSFSEMATSISLATVKSTVVHKANNTKCYENESNHLKGILRSASTSRKSLTKRELRFSIPAEITELTCQRQIPQPSPKSPIYVNSIIFDHKNKVIQHCHPENSPEKRISRKRKISCVFKPLKSKRFKANPYNEHHYNKENNDMSFSKKTTEANVIVSSATKTYRKPNTNQPHSKNKQPTSMESSSLCCNFGKDYSPVGYSTSKIHSPFNKIRLFSHINMFKCSRCKVSFHDSDSLNRHLSNKHRNIFAKFRPQYVCGICSSGFYHNKCLVRHCIENHVSDLETKSPYKKFIKIYKCHQKTTL